MRIDLIDVDADHGVDAVEAGGADQAEARICRTDQHPFAAQRDFRVRESAVGPLEQHRLLETEHVAEVLKRGARLVVIEIGDDPLRTGGRIHSAASPSRSMACISASDTSRMRSWNDQRCPSGSTAR